jgi:hypothetical protein
LLPLLAFLLGLKHSYDADHLVAVSNYLTRSHSVANTVRLSVSWAGGHMVTATAVTLLLYFFRETFLSDLLGQFEFLVAGMLMIVGLLAFKDLRLLHAHVHSHGGHAHAHRHLHLRGAKEHHYHRHMLGIGIVHGLASNDELLVLLTLSLSLTTMFGILAGLAIFTMGVVVGMVSYGLVLNYPLRRFAGDRMRGIVNIVAGALSIGYGIFLLLPF